MSGQPNALGHTGISQRCWAVKQLASKQIVLVVLLADHLSQGVAPVTDWQLADPAPLPRKAFLLPLVRTLASTAQFESLSAKQRLQPFRLDRVASSHSVAIAI